MDPPPPPSARSPLFLTVVTMHESLLHNPLPGISFVRVAESGTGPALLLLNGLSRPIESWESFIDVLPGRHVIAFDAPGIGQSPRPLFPLSIPMLAALAARVLYHFSVDKADVFGYSHGGAVAQQLALSSPECVRHLILAATTPGVGAPVGDIAALAATPSDPSWPKSDPLGVTWRLGALATWTSLPVLSQITSPTLVIAGVRDRVVPSAATDMLATLIPGAVIVDVEAGHDLQAPDAAAQLASVVERFLSH